MSVSASQAPPIEPPDDFSFEQQVEVILDLRPAVFSFVFGIPSAEILRECARRGILTAGAATTLEEAAALDEAGVDLIVATGSDAGGHRPSFLRACRGLAHGHALAGAAGAKDHAQARDRRRRHRGGQRHACCLCNSARMRCRSAPRSSPAMNPTARKPHREALFTPAAARTRLSRRFTGRLARFMSTPLLDELENSANPALPFPLQAAFNRPVKAEGVRRDDAELLPLYAGQAAPLIQHRRVEDLMRQLIAGLS
jgi:nitronate monooxygenase